MLFSELPLHPDIRKGIEAAGYTTCMPVQEQVFTHSFQGTDICAQSQTGTGKTAAFLVSIYQRMLTDPTTAGRKALILAPTRELAVQIQEEADRLGQYTGVRSGCFYGGVGYGAQYDLLRDGVSLVIGTPGRILDLIQQGRLILADVGFLIVDEADRMFDMGFIDDLRRILRYLPPPERRQSFLFSATLGMRIKDLAWEYMTKPAEIVIEPEHVTVDLVTQELYHVGTHEKFRLLLGLLAREKPRSAIVFCNQKNTAEEVSRRLGMNGIECDFIMGDLPQAKRLSIIDNLKAGTLEILVATDVAARGLDIEALDLVVNYDVPNETETYVHRIGRTARAGKSGKAVTLACERYVYGLPAIESLIGMRIPVCTFGDELMPEDKSARTNYRHSHDKGTSQSSRRAQGRDGRRVERPAHGVPRPGTKPGRITAPQEMPRSAEDSIPSQSVQRPPREQNPRRPETGVPRRRDTPEVSGAAPSSPNPYSMSQEERMRQYRARYGGNASSPPVQQGSPRNVAGGITQSSMPESKPQRLGLWARIKALFGGSPKSGD